MSRANIVIEFLIVAKVVHQITPVPSEPVHSMLVYFGRRKEPIYFKMYHKYGDKGEEMP